MNELTVTLMGIAILIIGVAALSNSSKINKLTDKVNDLEGRRRMMDEAIGTHKSRLQRLEDKTFLRQQRDSKGRFV